MKFADLHLHTLYSDGTYTPQDLVSESVRCSLSAISVTDHDSVEGIPLITELAKKENIEIIPGIELSCEYENQEVHILGYLLDYNDIGFLNKLDNLKRNRIERVKKITEKLMGMGLNLKPEAVFEIARQGTVGRLHIARAMVKEGLVSSIFEAFRKYIGDKCPAYVLNFKFSPSEAIKLIKDAGGIPVLAHPYILHNDALIIKLIENGIMGLEVYYPEHSQSMINFYMGIVKKYNLLVSGGSDCHGSAKPQVSIGSIKIPYELVVKLKEAKGRL